MDTKRIVAAIIKTILTIALIVVVGMVVYRLGAQAYNFGYRIFSEEPVSPQPGLTMSVAIVEGKSVMDIGKILEEKGLIRDHFLFYFQELFSNYHGDLKPGVYELSTAMTPEEMIEIMAAPAADSETDELEGSGNSASSNEMNLEEYDLDNPDYNPDLMGLQNETDAATEDTNTEDATGVAGE